MNTTNNRTAWDEVELRVVAGNYETAQTFADQVPQMRLFRDGVPPDQSTCPGAWLEAFWHRCKQDNSIGCRPITSLPASSPFFEAVASNVGAVWCRPFGNRGWTMIGNGVSVLLSAWTQPGHLVLGMIIINPRRKGYGSTTLQTLDSWAQSEGLDMVATNVTCRSFFKKHGWTRESGLVWRAPRPSLPIAA